MKEVSTYLLDFPLRTNLQGMIGTSSASIVRSNVVAGVGVVATDGANFFMGFRIALKMFLFPSKARMLCPVPLQAVMQAPRAFMQ